MALRGAERNEEEVLAIENHSKNVSAETCQSGWLGERMDYDMAITALLSKQENVQSAPPMVN